MKRHSQILAGTALGLLMASAPLAALPLPENSGAMPAGARIANAFDGQVILAQAATEETEEERLRREAEEAAEQAEEPAAEEPAAAPEAPVTAEEPVEEEAPAAAEEPAAAPEAPATAEESLEEEDPATAEEPAAAPEAPATAEEPLEEDPATAEEPAAAPEAPATAEEPLEEEDPAAAEEPAAAPETPATAEEPAAAPEAPATAEEPVEEEDPATADEPSAAPEAPATAEEPAEDPADPATAEEPAAEEDPATAEDPDAPADGEAAEGEPVPENAAPITDSAKEAPAEGTDGEQAAEPAAPEEAAPMPESDSAAQAQPIEEVESVTAEEGQRIEAGETREERRERRRERRERRDDAQVIEEFNDNRVIIQFNNQVFIESPDYERIIYDSNEVYYEELPRGRVREVIVRADGSRVITIRNRYGDVIRRSRILPDNREIVLVYVEDRYYDEILEWRDPGASLPPLVLSIPREEYILEAELVDDPDRYYAFFDQPPVEQIERTYSLNEVKRSARIRDTMRRVDLDTINFAFGSAEIEEGEIDELADVAAAMERMLEENPGETFLIEGHTDAVGSDLANLALSDQRAEAVANALTTVFAIPPENLTTQGYGEQYLKIETEEAERENRRVAIRRITPLVSPVASAE